MLLPSATQPAPGCKVGTCRTPWSQSRLPFSSTCRARGSGKQCKRCLPEMACKPSSSRSGHGCSPTCTRFARAPTFLTSRPDGKVRNHPQLRWIALSWMSGSLTSSSARYHVIRSFGCGTSSRYKGGARCGGASCFWIIRRKSAADAAFAGVTELRGAMTLQLMRDGSIDQLQALVAATSAKTIERLGQVSAAPKAMLRLPVIGYEWLSEKHGD